MAKKAAADEAPIEKEVRKLRKFIKSTRIAMFTTVATDGRLRSRPMANLKGGFDGDLWFVTRSTAPKAEEIKDNQHVNVSYADPDDERHQAATGARPRNAIDVAWARSVAPSVAMIRARR